MAYLRGCRCEREEIRKNIRNATSTTLFWISSSFRCSNQRKRCSMSIACPARPTRPIPLLGWVRTGLACLMPYTVIAHVDHSPKDPPITVCSSNFCLGGSSCLNRRFLTHLSVGLGHFQMPKCPAQAIGEHALY